MTLMLHPHSERLLGGLVDQANRHGLVLFVGSGINSSALSQWSALLGELLKRAIHEAGSEDPRMRELAKPLTQWCKAHFDVCAQASIVKQVLGAERYRLEIQDALFGKTPAIEREVEERIREYRERRAQGKRPVEREKRQFDFLWAVAELCSLPQVKGVATFNFDTLLEAAIRACGQKSPHAYFGQTATMDESGTDLAGVVIPVFHVHGLLSPPYTLLKNPAESVVFSLDEYFNKNADPLSWETATSLHLLRHFCTLWLGVSLKDWNMMRLLDAARSGKSVVQSYCLQCLQEVGTWALPRHQARDRDFCEGFQESAMRLQATLFDAVGMHLVLAGNRYPDLPAIVSAHITTPLRKSAEI